MSRARPSRKLLDSRVPQEAREDPLVRRFGTVVTIGAGRTALGRVRIAAVPMADGSTKPIGDIKSGDRVMAEDPEAGKRGPRTVTRVWVHGDDLVDFRIADDVVTTTEDHPFWNATDRQWEGPQEFDAGDRVLTADGNLLVTRGLVADSWHTGSAYNLTVNDIHTFYVVVAGEAVLVHNCPWSPSPNQVDQLIKSGQAPKSIVRVDTPSLSAGTGVPLHGEKTHVTFDDGSGLYMDGTWKENKGHTLTNKEIKWLRGMGWDL